MSVRYLFVCDACGATGQGVDGQYVHQIPPLGWTWRFGSGLYPPHACSPECWAKVEHAEDGRIILPATHDNPVPPPPLREQPPMLPAKEAPPLARFKSGRKVKAGSLTDLRRRVEALEGATRKAASPKPPSLVR